MSSNTSWFSEKTNLPKARPKRSAITSATVIAASAMATEAAPTAKLTPASMAVSTGRYSAIDRSSSTSSDSTIGVSRLPSRPRSASTLAVIPELVA